MTALRKTAIMIMEGIQLLVLIFGAYLAASLAQALLGY